MSLPAPTRKSASSKHVLYAEILSVTSAMRRNSRWASSVHAVSLRTSTNLGSNLGLRISAPTPTVPHSRRSSREAELMAGFQELKRSIKDVESEPLVLCVGVPNFAHNRQRHQRLKFADLAWPFLCHHTFAFIYWANNICCTFVVA